MPLATTSSIAEIGRVMISLNATEILH
jgi:hypothetical protein